MLMVQLIIHMVQPQYACRKTLADNRPRIRGRFARNDEAGLEIPKTSSSMFNRYEDEDDIWVMYYSLLLFFLN